MAKNWSAVTRKEPCPVCGKASWCGRSEDGGAVICMREPNGRPTRNGGWLYVWDEERREWREPSARDVPVRPGNGPRSASRPLGAISVPARLETRTVAAEMAKDADTYWGADLAEHLIGCGMSDGLLDALEGLGVYRAARFSEAVLAFPMRDERGEPVGIRYRSADGRKWSLRGGRDGLFFAPSAIFGRARTEELYIVEGATDTLALATIGLPVVGRSSCSTGSAMLAAIAARVRPSKVVIVADLDRTHYTARQTAYMPGRAGAVALTKAIGLPASIVFLGHSKDVRAFVRFRLAEGVIPGTIAGEIRKMASQSAPRIF